DHIMIRGRLDHLDDLDERVDRDDETRLLEQLARECIGQPFTALDTSTWQRPAAGTRCLTPPHQYDALRAGFGIAIEDDAADRNRWAHRARPDLTVFAEGPHCVPPGVMTDRS